MSKLESVLKEARKLPPEERRQFASRLLEEGEAGVAAPRDGRLEAMRAASDYELFLADPEAAMDDSRHADEDTRPA